jgi:hypothetical protein
VSDVRAPWCIYERIEWDKGEIPMSDRAERMKEAFAHSSTATSELRVLEVVSAEIDDLEARISGKGARIPTGRTRVIPKQPLKKGGKKR